MAKLTRDTAKKSIDAMFKALPAEAVVEVVSVGVPIRGTVLGVKIQIAERPREIRTAAKPAAGKGTDADVQGQQGTKLGSGPQRRRPQKG